MRVLVTGSSGLIGSALVPSLTGKGHSVTRLVRSETGRDGTIFWDPAGGAIDKGGLEGFDAVVHLAGESIAGGRWTTARKARIRESRSQGTRLLATILASLDRRPEVMVSASAMGCYGDRGDELLTEASDSGSGFLADVCRDWEQAADPARDRGIRVVHPRIGLVLSAAGGALRQMLMPFKLGLGGVIGSGRQYWSWITIDDLVAVFHHALNTRPLRGPVNAATPNPVTNREFTKALGRVVSRPTFFPLPAFAARLVLGEMANELLLSSQRLQPARLLESGFVFGFPQLEGGLRHVLGK